MNLLEKQKVCEHDFNIARLYAHSGSIPYVKNTYVCKKCLYTKIMNYE